MAGRRFAPPFTVALGIQEAIIYTMSIDQLFTLLHKYEEFNFTLWNIYIAVTLAALGYSIGSEKIRRLAPRALMAAAFFAFSLGNANYLERNTVLINATSAEIKNLIGAHKESSVEFKKGISNWASMQPNSLRIGHFILDAIIILLILLGPQLISGYKKSLIHEEDDA